MFYIDVAKVDQDIAYVAMVIHVCFQVYIPNVSSALDVCCQRFIYMLQKVDLNVAYVCNDCTRICSIEARAN